MRRGPTTEHSRQPILLFHVTIATQYIFITYIMTNTIPRHNKCFKSTYTLELIGKSNLLSKIQ